MKLSYIPKCPKAIFVGALALCSTATVFATDISTADVVKNLDNDNYVYVDTRHDSFYNGFKSENAKRGGHIKGAVQFTTEWLNNIDANKFESYVADKGITKDKTLVIYDTNKSNLELVVDEFETKGYNVLQYNDYLEYANNDEYPMEFFPRFDYLVSPQWVKDVIDGKKPETYNNDKYMVFHADWGPLEKAKGYEKHIPGAYHFNTDWVEEGPDWNLLPADRLEANLLKNGISKDKTIILYATNQLSAFRVMFALAWAGVEDVRLLNGGLQAWEMAGFDTETKINTPTPVTAFGTTVPANPKINISLPEDAIKGMKEDNLKLISIRSWPEYNGEIIGYDYISRKGEPEGAIWGFAGESSWDINDYYDPDGTLRNPKEIFALWKDLDINPNDHVSFYCGTGWRAGAPWLMTEMAGWENASIFDGGWNMWQLNSKLPVQKGAPNNMQKPSAKNDYKANK